MLRTSWSLRPCETGEQDPTGFCALLGDEEKFLLALTSF